MGLLGCWGQGLAPSPPWLTSSVLPCPPRQLGSVATLLPLHHPTGGASLNLGTQGPSDQAREKLALSCVPLPQGRSRQLLLSPPKGLALYEEF